MNPIEGHLPTRSPLHDILAPKGIAVVGASADPTKRGYKAMVGLVKEGYRGNIYPVNPKAEMILGVKAWPSVSAIPGSPELALLCTPAATVPGLIAECGRRGVKGVVILASGFGETGPEGAALEREMMAKAEAHGVRIIGPNTSGIFNLHHNINLLALDNLKPGDIGIVSQSGNMLLSLALEAQYNGQVGFSTYIGPGNQSDIGFNDYLRYLGEDENTRVATLYVEGFRDGRKFLEVAREVTAMKPVVVYKSGSTEQGRQAASSHTGALAGSYQMTVDLLRQHGVSVVQYSDEILPVAEGLGLLQKASGKRVAVIADGGGQATIASDRLAEAGLALAELSDTSRERLRTILLPQASTRNPVDVAGSSDSNPALLAECMRIVAEDDNVDSVLLVGMFGGYSLRFAESLLGDEMRGAEAMVDLSNATDKPLVIYSLYAPIKPPALRRLHEAGLPIYASIEHAVRVLAALGERGLYLAQQEKHLEQGASEPSMLPIPSMRAVFERARQEGRDFLEYEAKALLAEHGIEVPKEQVAINRSDLVAIADEFGEIPLAMKVVSRDILHKSDAGGVKLNLVGKAALARAFDQIMASCHDYDPKAAIEGVLVTPMARKGVEVIIGVIRDPIFGPVLMFGLGGIFVEILEDVAFRSIPLTGYDADCMVEQLKAKKVLEGARGEAGVNKAALVDLLLKVSRIVQAYPQLSELDLNPVIAYPDGYAVVDARVIVEPGQ
ncbi:CoA-binding protein [Halomonas sp. ZH2S]|uniref:CoA-binding protein n=1 Tax=Vreelandella zhuhanensis TaxID=2684210 RepID=A0A7X3H485_9GAMM|nr:acetate--CoA ligase [Halomonas zhuhanensis]MWJ29140.1 CoA-binding protein [Halomonas zhuhanensis]